VEGRGKDGLGEEGEEGDLLKEEDKTGYIYPLLNSKLIGDLDIVNISFLPRINDLIVSWLELGLE